MVHQTLWDAGIKPRFGQVTMIAAQPNAGKSMFALHLAIRWVTQHGLWGYIFSADTDETDTKKRAGANLLKMPQDEVEELMSGPGEEWLDERLEALRDLRMAYKTDPDTEFVMAELDAFNEAYGAHPDFVVIDNLVNLVGDIENDKRGLMELQAGFKYIARSYGCAVVLLHHCSESSGDPEKPPARKYIQNKVSELPEQIMTVAYDGEQGKFGVAGVKLRGAKADPKAERPVWLEADFGSCYFSDPVYRPHIPSQERWWEE